MELKPLVIIEESKGTQSSTFKLNIEAIKELEEVIQKNGVCDLPVAVVSVVGGFRGGKSFMLNLFLLYLTALEEVQYMYLFIILDS